MFMFYIYKNHDLQLPYGFFFFYKTGLYTSQARNLWRKSIVKLLTDALH